VTIKAAKLATMKDVLWPKTIIPVPPISCQTGVLETLEFDGYLLFNDEADTAYAGFSYLETIKAELVQPCIIQKTINDSKIMQRMMI